MKMLTVIVLDGTLNARLTRRLVSVYSGYVPGGGENAHT